MDFKSPTIFKIETDYINNSFYPDLYSINKNFFDCNNSITFPEKYCYNEYNLKYKSNETIAINDKMILDKDIENKTNPNSFLSEKTKRNEINDKNENFLLNEKDEEKENNIERNIFKNIKNININENLGNNISERKLLTIEIKKENAQFVKNRNNIINNIIKKGRKADIEKKKGNNGKHTKNNDDNKIRKIKSFFWKSLYKYLKKKYFNEENYLLKLNININRRLKRNYNLALFNRTLKDIYSNECISDKYKLKNTKTNKSIIEKIYKDNKQKDLITLLDLTYGEAFDIFRRNYKVISSELKSKVENTGILNSYTFSLDALLQKIENEGKENNENDEDIKNYKDDIINLCKIFENWFVKKTGRIGKNKNVII